MMVYLMEDSMSPDARLIIEAASAALVDAQFNLQRVVAQSRADPTYISPLERMTLAEAAREIGRQRVRLDLMT
jgi:hypothetical protein